MSERTCAIEGCSGSVLSRGWCRLHYGRWYRYGDPTATAPQRQAAATCSVEGCEGSHAKIKLGMCGKHYQRYAKYGSTELPPRTYRICSGPDCARGAGTSGLCRSHYKQSHLGKPLAPLLVASKDLVRPAQCLFPGCGRPHKARGLCKAHRDQAAKAQELRPATPYGLGLACVEKDCIEVAIARGRCSKHRQFLYDLAIKYNLTIEQHDAMLEAQGGTCAICGGTNPNGYRLAIDHDHACCLERHPVGDACAACFAPNAILSSAIPRTIPAGCALLPTI